VGVCAYQGPAERRAWQLDDLAGLALGQTEFGDQLLRGGPLGARA